MNYRPQNSAPSLHIVLSFFPSLFLPLSLSFNLRMETVGTVDSALDKEARKLCARALSATLSETLAK